MRASVTRRTRGVTLAVSALSIAWALPCSLVGIALALPILAAGGAATRVGGAVEVVLYRDAVPSRSRLRRLPFAAITFGHVILALSGRQIDALRAHEHVHVRQYEALGPLFPPAYVIASVLALARGGHPYADNAFESRARRETSS